jgi:hypothetical protein
MVFSTVLSVLLLAGGLPFQALPGASEDTEEWNLYDFIGTEHFKYDVALTEEGETQEGFFTLDLEPKGEKTKLKFVVELGDDTFESSVTVDDEDDLMGSLMGQMMFNPAAAPLTFTLFAPWMAMFPMFAQWELGSSWSFNDGETSTSYSVEEECEHAGITGLKAVWKENDEVRSEICVSTDHPLPLMIFFKDEEEATTYHITLVEYEE